MTTLPERAYTDNLLGAVDDRLMAELEKVRGEKIDAMDRYVEAARKEAELQSLLELRKALGAAITGLPSYKTLTNGEAA